MEFNEYETTCNEQPSFKISGHDVTIMSPALARITIHVPWGRNEDITPERQAYVMRHTQFVVNYMLGQGLMMNDGKGVGIMVETEFHPVNQ